MAGGYFIDESTHVEDMAHQTQPVQLSVDSPCGAAALPLDPAPAKVAPTKEVV